MDRGLQLKYLAGAEYHIARGAHHILDQEMRVADLDLRGHDSTLASSFLESIRRTQAQHVAHRDRILTLLGPKAAAVGDLLHFERHPLAHRFISLLRSNRVGLGA